MLYYIYYIIFNLLYFIIQYLLYRMTSQTWLCFSGTLEKVTCHVYKCKLAYTEQVTFYKVPEKKEMFIFYLVTLYNILYYLFITLVSSQGWGPGWT